MRYEVKFSKGAKKQFRKLPLDIQERIQTKINDLAIEPRPNGVKKLQGDDNSYRVRVGDYRVIYELNDDVLIVTVIKIGHRSEIYKDGS
ncbi:type II toxin-antitoxin system mRNA interferase toxin, RelE/StbE family [Nostoc sp. 'Peltigera membranacea cyanobiont' 210A]|uniref:type II toxin-antitoxin system RelE family toxin n=1 Tax=Nostoc sp. 'Peltigera membranacea cyanobiont' 210A TaxID=2014529 RepID=UPI000B957503|nr:type II toxin-antitoxin system RelE/ParE family toxin [Nostoc sp. 'Peltigera membranacea cyanobiont' 210A]OYD96773.1 type II toxin-antitoxin system mRNA interferase toxin, RelE/StbE family [Nostoc sp. 'Peltigera membranacea cyanobiont' 210A]